jgi:flavin-binding protein dodecin
MTVRHRSGCLYFLNTNEDQRRKFMSEHVYKQIELTGSSKKSIDDAVSTAIAKASKTLRNLHWFEVIETRGQIEDDKVAYWPQLARANAQAKKSCVRAGRSFFDAAIAGSSPARALTSATHRPRLPHTS